MRVIIRVRRGLRARPSRPRCSRCVPCRRERGPAERVDRRGVGGAGGGGGGMAPDRSASKHEHLIGPRPHERCVTSGAAPISVADARFGLPHHASRLVAIDDRDAVVHFFVIAMEVTTGERGEQRVANHGRIETDDGEAEDRDLRRSAAAIGQLEQASPARSACCRRRARARWCLRGERGRRRLPAGAAVARRAIWKPMKCAASDSRNSASSLVHSAGSNTGPGVPPADAQLIDREDPVAAEREAASCQARCPRAAPHEPGAARECC